MPSRLVISDNVEGLVAIINKEIVEVMSHKTLIIASANDSKLLLVVEGRTNHLRRWGSGGFIFTNHVRLFQVMAAQTARKPVGTKPKWVKGHGG